MVKAYCWIHNYVKNRMCLLMHRIWLYEFDVPYLFLQSHEPEMPNEWYNVGVHQCDWKSQNKYDVHIHIQASSSLHQMHMLDLGQSLLPWSIRHDKAASYTCTQKHKYIHRIKVLRAAIVVLFLLGYRLTFTILPSSNMVMGYTLIKNRK